MRFEAVFQSAIHGFKAMLTHKKDSAREQREAYPNYGENLRSRRYLDAVLL